MKSFYSTADQSISLVKCFEASKKKEFVLNREPSKNNAFHFVFSRGVGC